MSFRHAESRRQADEIKAGLRLRGISCFVSGEAAFGLNIAERIANFLMGAKMVVFMGTCTYGTATTSFSTWHEMQSAQAQKKFIFPIKMLRARELFTVQATSIFFDSGVKFFSWEPDAEQPPDLMDELVKSARESGITPAAVIT